jgi:DNA-binding LacI/PurR family transcriptional regulator
MVKLIDVARAAKVSVATASLVMNRRPGVKGETRLRVLAAAENLGYSPNNRARGLALRKTNTIGLVVTDIENPFFGSITRHIDEYTRDAGYNLVLSVSNDDLDLEDQIIDTFISERVDGVIIIPTLCQRTDMSCFRRLEKHNIPYVFCTSFYPGVSCDCVMTDLRSGSYELAAYLLRLGHRVIYILVSSSRAAVPSKLRIEGCMGAFDDFGIAYDESWIIECEKPDFNHGFTRTTETMGEQKPDAVMAINDITALGAKRALKEMGYMVPDDIAVAGYDDVIFSSISEIPLTTVRQPVQEICSQTVGILIERIRGDRSAMRFYMISPELVIRKSTERKQEVKFHDP